MPVVKSSHHKKRKAEAGGAEAESSDSDSEAEAEAAPVQWAAVPGFVPPA